MGTEGRRLVMPEHVVFRQFPAETVVLNLESGTYHGLNETAARMLEALLEHGTQEAAAAEVAEALGVPLAQVTDDLRSLCASLVERGLLEESG